MKIEWELKFKSQVAGIYSKESIHFFDKKRKISVEAKWEAQENQENQEKIETVEFYCDYFKEGESKATVIKDSKQVVMNIISVISYKYNATFTTPFLEYIHEVATHTKTYRGEITLEHIHPTEITKDDIQEIKQEFEDGEFLGSLFSTENKIIRNIIKKQDIIGGYVALYGILEKLKGPNQNNIDKFIRKQKDYYIKGTDRDSTRLDRKTQLPYRQETIYTWLRNQIGHTKRDADINKIFKEIEENYRNLVEIVKIAVEETQN